MPILAVIEFLLTAVTAQFGATGLGSLFLDEVLNRTWGYYPTSTPLDTLRARNKLQSSFLASTRLSIPISFCEELLHSEPRGVISPLALRPVQSIRSTFAAGGWGGTLFPGPPLLAQTFNTSLIEAIGAAIAVEGRATGVDTGLSPVVNLFTDPRFGRYHEGLSADPGVTAKIVRLWQWRLRCPGHPCHMLPTRVSLPGCGDGPGATGRTCGRARG